MKEKLKAQVKKVQSKPALPGTAQCIKDEAHRRRFAHIRDTFKADPDAARVHNKHLHRQRTWILPFDPSKRRKL